MRLKAITVQLYRNIVDAQRIEIEGDVTCLVGKNEAGKTTILKALHRLKPAKGSVDTQFDQTTEYPRWRLARDRKKDASLAKTRPIVAEFELDDAVRALLTEKFGIAPPESTVCFSAKDYENTWFVWLEANAADRMAAAIAEAGLLQEDIAALPESATAEAVKVHSKEQAKLLKDAGETLRAKSMSALPGAMDKVDALFALHDMETRDALGALLPSFFYFSAYNILPGECDLTVLNEKILAGMKLTESERTIVALLAHAGEEPADFLDNNYNSRKAELQAASVDLSRHVFEYWKQNEDLQVVFDTDNVLVAEEPNREITHRILKIELRDARHGDVETNFSTRSTGFQWFFSFFAAFSEYQESDKSIVVLLDEPGTSLHGDAQRDFVRFVFEELGASKQTLYTTHSQHMVDPTKYEKLRAVHDRATRADPDLGVVITRADLSADRGTILPIESALGYSISQHLFLGSGQHLAVEGSSDFVYLQRMTEHLASQNKKGLDPRLAMLPVGGADNMPAFVALLGRRLRVSALVDGDRTNSKLARIKKAAENNNVPSSAVVVCSDVDGVPTNADIEDLFTAEDYLRLYNWAFSRALLVSDLANTSEPIVKRITDRDGMFDHALPAHALTEHREEFFASVSSDSVERFGRLFELLNATVQAAS